MHNKKLPEKERRFMIFQESIEGIMHLGLFLIMATAFTALGVGLVKTGKLLPGLVDKVNGKEVILAKDQV